MKELKERVARLASSAVIALVALTGACVDESEAKPELPTCQSLGCTNNGFCGVGTECSCIPEPGAEPIRCFVAYPSCAELGCPDVEETDRACAETGECYCAPDKMTAPMRCEAQP